MESNPLGIKLPSLVEKPLNKLARRLLPKTFERLEENRVTEAINKAKGIDLPMPGAELEAGTA